MKDNELREKIKQLPRPDNSSVVFQIDVELEDIIDLITAERARWELEVQIETYQQILEIAKQNEDALGWEAAYSSVCDVASMRITDLTTQLNNLKEK
jgi:hypothetical protein